MEQKVFKKMSVPFVLLVENGFDAQMAEIEIVPLLLALKQRADIQGKMGWARSIEDGCTACLVKNNHQQYVMIFTFTDFNRVYDEEELPMIEANYHQYDLTQANDYSEANSSLGEAVSEALMESIIEVAELFADEDAEDEQQDDLIQQKIDKQKAKLKRRSERAKRVN